MRVMPFVFAGALAVMACGGKKPAPVDAATTPPAEDAAMKAEDAAMKAEDAAMKAEDAAAKPADAAAPAGDAAAPAGDAAAPAGDAAMAGDAAAPASAELLKHGEYIANVAGCRVCHTALGPQGPMVDKAFAGGLEITEPIGTWRTPNITQDKKTGIGGWTDAEILTAVRQGKRPDGSQMYVHMPYTFYNKMSDGDAKALVAYLRTVPAIENAVAGNTDLKLPKIPMPPPEGVEPGTDPVKRGEYLTTMMHCSACHTPNTEQGPDMTKFMAGGDPIELAQFGDGVLHPANLTPHATGLAAYTDAEIIAVLKEAKKKDGSPVFGPMMLLAMTWKELTDADAAAIVAYLKSLPPIDNKVAASTFKPKGPPPPPPPGDAPAPGADAGAAAPDAAGGGDKGDAKP